MNNKTKTILIGYNTTHYAWMFRRNLVEEFLALDYRVIVVAPVDEYVQKLESLGVSHINIKMQMNANPVSDLFLFFRYCGIFMKWRPDFFLGYTAKPNIYGTLAAKLFGTKVINNIAGLGSVFLKKNVVTFFLKSLYRLALQYSDQVFFQNQDDLQEFLKSKIITHNRYDVLPGSGVDLKKFQYTELAYRDGMDFLFIGRLIRDKGIYEFIAAAKKLLSEQDDLRFKILGAVGGDNPTAISASSLAKDLAGTSIEYIGFKEDVLPFITAATCVVLPSYREGTPKCLLEAAAVGRPIVTTNAPGCKDVVDEGVNGYVCCVADEQSLYDALKKLSSLSLQQLTKMGLAGRSKIVNQYDERIVINRYLEAVQQS